MTDLDPKDLINIPGAGRAEIACRAVGSWDDGRAPDAVDWEVEVWATTVVSQIVKVRAVTAEEAERLGVAKAQIEADWRRPDNEPTMGGALAREVGRD